MLDSILKPKKHSSSTSSTSSSESKETKAVVDAMYKLGLKHGKQNVGADKKSAASISSDEAVMGRTSLLPLTVHDSNDAKEVSEENKTSASALKGSHIDAMQIPDSSNGRFVSSPPKVSRVPIHKSYGGDFANGKDPVDLTQGGTPIENSNPQYSNVSKTVDGEGNFFEPKDTQGGVYKENHDQIPAKHDRDSSLRKTHRDPETVVPGGVVIGNYGKHTEATQAEIKNRYTGLPLEGKAEGNFTEKDQKALETDLYNEGQRQAKPDAEKSKSLEQQLYDAGREKAFQESDRQLFESARTSTSKLRSDSNEEHEQNRSVYNPGGVQGVIEQLKSGTHGQNTNTAYVH